MRSRRRRRPSPSSNSIRMDGFRNTALAKVRHCAGLDRIDVNHNVELLLLLLLLFNVGGWFDDEVVLPVLFDVVVVLDSASSRSNQCSSKIVDGTRHEWINVV